MQYPSPSEKEAPSPNEMKCQNQLRYGVVYYPNPSALQVLVLLGLVCLLVPMRAGYHVAAGDCC